MTLRGQEAFMKTKLASEQKSVKLEENQVMSFKKIQNLFVTSGNIWMTVAGDSEDYFYSEGDCVKIPNGKHTVIQAIGRATFWL